MLMIDEAPFEVLLNHFGYVVFPITKLKEAIKRNTVDAEPVVRCKDCRWHEDEEPGMVFCSRVTDSWVSNDFYCASGRRKDGAKP